MNPMKPNESEIAPMAQPKTLQELFARDGSWTQRWSARDSNGRACEPNASAARYCMRGGLLFLHGPDRIHPHEMKLRRALESRGEHRSYIAWNDHEGRTIEEIRELVKEANV